MADEDVFQRLMAKQQELERMRKAIQELQTLDDVSCARGQKQSRLWIGDARAWRMG